MAVLIRHAEETAAEKVAEAGAEGVAIRWLIHEDDAGAERFVMRQFEVAPGGFTPRHRHAWEHEVYVLSGRGTVATADGDLAVRPGDAVLVPAGEEHQFRSLGAAPLRFLCLIPARRPCP